jgi:hypothetical protein
VKLFVNRDNMGFDDAEEFEATQVLELSPEDVAEGRQIPLKIVKFQRVNSLAVSSWSVFAAEVVCMLTFAC